MELQVLTRHQKPSMERMLTSSVLGNSPSSNLQGNTWICKRNARKRTSTRSEIFLPVDQTDLKDGESSDSDTKGKQKWRRQKAHGALSPWQASETINGSDVKFVGTWNLQQSQFQQWLIKQFTSLSAELKAKSFHKKWNPSSRPNRLERRWSSNSTYQTEVKTAEGTWSFKSMTRHQKPSMERTLNLQELGNLPQLQLHQLLLL